jgi:hypothetical protein
MKFIITTDKSGKTSVTITEGGAGWVMEGSIISAVACLQSGGKAVLKLEIEADEIQFVNK